MNDHKILEELLNDIESMSVEELKASLLRHAYGPIHSIVTFDPYEAMFRAYAVSINYKLAASGMVALRKFDFINIVKNLDADRSVANLVSQAANDECYNFMLAA
ncbi:hypothetical protein M2G96_03615 [Vibrio vulnificus]|uniref:hypothetical protein n=1 Tax=Vibrio vulnificus TaxID=672 RepID=UPI000D3E8222|nr:hypothetical protein [Vibrio vulnificus]MBN8108632.1 hypothetical protein [Vibrio vulnificus]MCU8213324.1 hypothetical protein [Vibrio vulnificus]PUZ89458.1 hypothetical protein DC360_04495 [Vibrio vulnificus]